MLDAALIIAAQAVEHYEITRYGSLIAWAEELGKDAVAKLLTTTLDGGKGGRQEADRDCREQGQPEGRGLIAIGRRRRAIMNVSGERTRSLWMKVEVAPGRAAPRGQA